MITGFTHTVQLSVFLKAVGAGYALGILFILFGFINSFCGKRSIFTFFRDVLFFVTSAIFSFLFVLKYNAGIMRFYIVSAEFIGFLLFYIFPGCQLGEYGRASADKMGQRVRNLFTKVGKTAQKNFESIKKIVNKKTEKKVVSEKRKRKKDKKKLKK